MNTFVVGVAKHNLVKIMLTDALQCICYWLQFSPYFLTEKFSCVLLTIMSHQGVFHCLSMITLLIGHSMTSIPFLYFAASLAQYTLNPCSRCWKTYLSWEKTDKTCFKRKSVPSNTKEELIVLFCFDFDVLWLKLWASVHFRFVFRGWLSVLNVARFSVVWNSFDKVPSSERLILFIYNLQW